MHTHTDLHIFVWTEVAYICLCSTQIKTHLNAHFHLAKPALQQHSPQLEWKQLELVLSDFKTDWCDTAFQTTALSSLRVISVSCLQAFNNSRRESRSPTGLYLTGRVSLSILWPLWKLKGFTYSKWPQSGQHCDGTSVTWRYSSVLKHRGTSFGNMVTQEQWCRHILKN